MNNQIPRSDEAKLAKNSALLLLGNLTSKILVFFMVPFYTSVLTTDEYAVSDLMTTTVNLVFPLLTLSVTQGVLRFCLDKEEDHGQILSISFWIELIGCVLAVFMSSVVFQGTQWEEYRWLFAGYYCAYAINTLMLQYAKGKEHVYFYAVAGCINTVLLIVSNIIMLVVVKNGIKGYLLSMCLSNGISALYLFVRCHAIHDIIAPKKIDKNKMRRMLRYTLPLIPSSVSWWINTSSNRYILNVYSSLSELGLYSAANKIPSIQYMIMSALMGAWEISAVDNFGTEDNKQFFSKMYQQYLSLLIVTCVGISLLAKPLAGILYQKDFYQAWIYVPVLSVASTFEILSLFIGTIFTAAKRPKEIFITTTVGAALNIAFNLLMIPLWGAMGAAIATALAYVTVYLSRLLMSHKYLKLDIPYLNCHLQLIGVMVVAILVCMESVYAYLVGLVILAINIHAIIGIAKKSISMVFSIVSRFSNRKSHTGGAIQ